MEANPPGCIDLPDLVGPQQMADPQPPVVEVVAAEQRDPTPAVTQGACRLPPLRKQFKASDFQEAGGGNRTRIISLEG